MQDNPFVLTREGRAARITYLQSLLENPPDPAYCMDDVGCGEGHTEEDHDRIELELHQKVQDDPEIMAELDDYFAHGGQPFDPDAEEEEEIPSFAGLALALALAAAFGDEDEDEMESESTSEDSSELDAMFSALPAALRQRIISQLEADVAEPWSEELDTPKECCGRTGREHLSDRLDSFRQIHAQLGDGEPAETHIDGHVALALTPFGAIVMGSSEDVPPAVYAALEEMFGPILHPSDSEAPTFASFNLN